ncbi:hypothetical protein [Pseudoflavonifractor phocaeensis]|uniref:hypothetical protein n=1 Tax=Pseudoflavonifractor phocaeensis TaxID=1870988 RepID=UPI00195A0748|nr:hypothetical protein [Pseudoflavonifractor phocaeensis]MBM6870805.1 hypothetical protein [Pseudoflavonifractor phocaeensis]
MSGGMIYELTLIAMEPVKNELAEEVLQPGRETKILGRVESVSRSEWYDAGREGMAPEMVFVTPAVNYRGEQQAQWQGERYKIYRTYRRRSSQEIELYLGRRVGVSPS